MSRATELLKAAAVALEDGNDPFHTNWLADNDVTFNECMDLSESLAIGARLLAWVIEHPHEASAALNGAQMATAHRLLIKALARAA